MSTSFFVSDTCSVTFERVNRICTLYCGKILSIYCACSLQRISATLTPSVHENKITVLCYYLVHAVSGATMFTTLMAQGNWTVKVKYITTEHGVSVIVVSRAFRIGANRMENKLADTFWHLRTTSLSFQRKNGRVEYSQKGGYLELLGLEISRGCLHLVVNVVAEGRTIAGRSVETLPVWNRHWIYTRQEAVTFIAPEADGNRSLYLQ